jgi:hypothetical protein
VASKGQGKNRQFELAGGYHSAVTMGDHTTKPPIRIIVEFADECRITLSLRRVWVLLPAQLKTVEDLSAYLVENYIEGPLGASAHVQILLEVGNLHQTIPIKNRKVTVV